MLNSYSPDIPSLIINGIVTTITIVTCNLIICVSYGEGFVYYTVFLVEMRLLLTFRSYVSYGEYDLQIKVYLTIPFKNFTHMP